MSSKIRQLTKDTLLYGISTIVGRFINFILVPLYTNLFIPEEYGIVTNIYAYIALVSIVFLFGMDTAYLKYAGMAEESERPALFANALYPILLIDAFFAVMLFALKPAIGSLLGIPVPYRFLLDYMTVILILDSLAALPFIALRLRKKALRFSVIKLTGIVVTILLNIILIIYLKLGIAAVFISNLAASGLTLLILLPEIYIGLRGRLQKGLVKKMFAFGLPYLPSGIASMFMQVIDRPIVEKIAGMKMLGIYQANYRLGIFMMLFVSMFQFAWQPFFLENAKEENAKQIFASVMTYFTAVCGLILVVLSLFIGDLAMLRVHGASLIGSAYWEGLNIVPIVLLAYVFNGFHVVFSAGLFIKEKSIVFPVIMSIGALSNVLANILLLPVLGITGAAFATLISYFLMSAGFYYVSNKVYPVVYETRKLLIILALTAIAAALFYSLQAGNMLTLWFKISIAAGYTGGLFLFDILNPKALILFRRKK